MKKISVFLPLLVMLLALCSSAKAQVATSGATYQVALSGVNYHRLGTSVQVLVKAPSETTYREACTHRLPGATTYPTYTMATYSTVEEGSTYQVKAAGKVIFTDPRPINADLTLIVTKDTTGNYFVNWYF